MTRGYIPWTTKEEKSLAEVWVNGKPLKQFMHLFHPGRTYDGVLKHGQHIGLGPRPNAPRCTYSAVWESVEAILKTGARLTCMELAEKTGFSARQIRDQMEMRHGNEDERTVHIATWVRAGESYKWVQVWANGNGPDCPKPKAVSTKEMRRRKRERVKVRVASKPVNPFAVAMNQVMQEAA